MGLPDDMGGDDYYLRDYLFMVQEEEVVVKTIVGTGIYEIHVIITDNLRICGLSAYWISHIL